MATTKRQDVCFGTKYTDDTGKEQTRWTRIGKAFHGDSGRISIKFDTIPVGGWDGWVNLFDEQDRTQSSHNGNRADDLQY